MFPESESDALCSVPLGSAGTLLLWVLVAGRVPGRPTAAPHQLCAVLSQPPLSLSLSCSVSLLGAGIGLYDLERDPQARVSVLRSGRKW